MLKKILSLILSFSLIYLPLPLSFSAPSTLSTDLEHTPSTTVNNQENSNQNLSSLQAVPKDPTTEFLGNSPLTSASGSENVLTLSGDPVLGGSGQHLSQAICSSFGDADCDYDIDQNDYLLWRSNFGKSAAEAGFADFNGNGTVDAADYTIWRDHLGGHVIDETPVLAVNSTGHGAAEFFINGDSVYRTPYRGFNVAVLDPFTGLKLVETANFDTWLSYSNFDSFMNYINAQVDGYVISIGVADDSGLVNASTGTLWNNSHVASMVQFLENLGSTQIRNIKYRGGWSMIFVKGGGVLGEAVSNSYETASLSMELPKGLIRFDIAPRIKILTEIPEFINRNEIEVSYTVDGVPKQRTLTLQNGENQIPITETNDFGQSSTVFVKTTVEKVAPIGGIIVSNIDESYPNQTNYHIGIWGDDNLSGISEYRYALDTDINIKIWTKGTISKPPIFISTAVGQLGAVSGKHTLQVQFRDKAGNESEVFTTVVYAPVPPQVYAVGVGLYYLQTFALPSQPAMSVSGTVNTVFVYTSRAIVTDLVTNPGLIALKNSSGDLVPTKYVTYDLANNRFVISTQENLPPGQYTIQISDDLVDANNRHLDGDGDGVPGGDFVFTFNLVNPTSQGAMLVQSSAVSAEPVLNESFRGQLKKYYLFYAPWQEKHFAFPDLYRGKPDEKKSDALDFINFYRFRYPEKTARNLRWISFLPHLRS